MCAACCASVAQRGCATNCLHAVRA
jgi:hypothetical protein